MAKFWPFKTKFWPFFGQYWQFWEFLAYNFQTPQWIFLIFGMELLWILTLSGEPIILCLVIYYYHFIIYSLLFLKLWDWSPLFFMCFFFNLAATERPQHCVLVIINFKALKLASAMLMFFFLFGRRRETSALRACFIWICRSFLGYKK